MTAIDWTWVGWGALAGGFASALFFAGLAWGMTRALASTRPTMILMISSAVRIAALLAVGWLVAGQGGWALGGFVLGFVLVRFAILIVARRPAPDRGTSCN
ncbi:ATP synthase subunit I [Aliiroseovarius sp. S1339]|uniref:ATP synthase subunit I n=1 Tax=Aliiroseovarius sp. S1339 TaxID=2936990 RepID=UPI0020C076C4|nr:ATP synthase subunit I [Aliiroseovarius sp. S1339]MCK8465526.1 ATP synthase subunit I [Aliiroseovarius sp. S1339]